jgi:nucleoid-associated protein YgaU
MGISRYTFAKRNSENVGPSGASYKINRAVKAGALTTTTAIIKEGERLDQISARTYGDPSYWWVIAAASGIGWGMQVPPGIVLTIPTDLSDVMSLLI